MGALVLIIGIWYYHSSSVGHLDIAMRCGRTDRDSSPSTSLVPLSNQVTNLESQTIQKFKYVFRAGLKNLHRAISGVSA